MSEHEKRRLKAILEDWSDANKVRTFLYKNLPRRLGVHGSSMGNGQEVVLYHDKDNQADIARAVAKLLPKEVTIPLRYVHSARAFAC